MKKFNRNLIVTAFIVSLAIVSVGPLTALADDNLTSVNLGAAGNFAILAKTGISTTGGTSIVGDIGISPAAASYITGFGLVLPASGAFSTSALVTGKVYAPDYANPTPATLSTAVLDMQNAYTDVAGRDPDVTELGAGNIGGRTLTTGVYKWSTGLLIPTDVTLSGDANDIWIFQVAQNLNVSSAAKIILSGGAQSGNVFWAVAGQTTLGTTSVFNGNILDQTSIVLNTGATLHGRALAQTAVTLDSSSLSIPVVSMTYPYPTPSTYQYPTPSYAYPTPLINVTPGTSVITNVAGCAGTTGFSATTGQPCSGNSINATAGAKYNFGLVTLRSGSRGEAVMELQRFLNAKLSLGLVVDGKLGPKTIAVIKKWQMDNGLVADGLIGAKTKARMNATVQ